MQSEFVNEADREFGMKQIMIAVALGVVMAACSESSDDNTSALIDPANADSVMNSILVKVGGATGTLKSGSIPAPADPDAASMVTAAADELTAANNSTAKADLTFATDSPLALLYLKVVGASRFAEVVLPGAGSKTQLQSVDIELPTNFGDGRFCVDISGEDTDGQRFNPARVCISVESTADDSFTAAQVLSNMQGDWSLPCDAGEGTSSAENLSISGNTVQFQNLFWAQSAACAGDPDEIFEQTIQFALGAELGSDGGMAFRALDATIVASDNPDDEGETFLEIVFADGNSLIFGDDSSVSGGDRPVRLADTGFSPGLFDGGGDNGGGNNPDNTPLGEQTWEYQICQMGTFSVSSPDFPGSFDEDIDECNDVEITTGEDIPQTEQEGQEEIDSVSEMIEQDFREGCDEGSTLTASLENFDYLINGSGGVGTTIETMVDLLIQGTCKSSDGDVTYDIDITVTATGERIS